MVDTDGLRGSLCGLWFNVKWLNSLSMFPNLFNVFPAQWKRRWLMGSLCYCSVSMFCHMNFGPVHNC